MQFLRRQNLQKEFLIKKLQFLWSVIFPRVQRGDEENRELLHKRKSLWQKNGNVCTSLPFKLLCQWMCILSIPMRRTNILQEKTYTGRNKKKLSHCRIWDTNVLHLRPERDPVNNPLEYILESIKTISILNIRMEPSAG